MVNLGNWRQLAVFQLLELAVSACSDDGRWRKAVEDLQQADREFDAFFTDNLSTEGGREGLKASIKENIDHHWESWNQILDARRDLEADAAEKAVLDFLVSEQCGSP